MFGENSAASQYNASGSMKKDSRTTDKENLRFYAMQRFFTVFTRHATGLS
jgi:hypothetical protein